MANSIGIVIVSLIVHAILLVSIFDIYFTSQVESGLEPQYFFLHPPAKRLVLIVADGLKADTLFSLTRDGDTHAPFLRDVMERRGRWGVSHTRVPTESRPGHVAIIAGLYEDVSAVTRGWQENPVQFDSLFNRSKHTWSWGSPDILPMFSQGAVKGKVDSYMYDSAWEDFADSEASKLDTWVFDKVNLFFKQASTNTTLAEKLAEEKNVIFLHLLGIDTNGHAHRPYSNEVIDNLKYIDKEIEKTEIMLNNYFRDDKTTFVFTSDHGMTDWGSHGAGLPEETMTPLVCWGAGIKNPRSNAYALKVYHDGYSKKWQLDRIERVDVNQADIAPLMATLIGVPIPVNSEGILPMGYIHYNKGFIAAAIETNSIQLFKQVEKKASRLHSNSLPLTFRPFPKMTSLQMADQHKKISSFWKQKQYQMVIDLSLQQIEIYQAALRYYHTYHRISLFIVLSLGFLGWMLCIVIQLAADNCEPNKGSISGNFSLKTLYILSLVFFLLFLQSSPMFYYLYYSLVLFTWSFVWSSRTFLRRIFHDICSKLIHSIRALLIAFGMIELVVISFYYRETWSLILILLSLWPYLTEARKEKVLSTSWTAVCLTLAIFPLLPIVGRSANYVFVAFAGLMMFCLSLALLNTPKISYILCFSGGQSRGMKHLLIIQTTLLLLSSFVPAIVNWYFRRKLSIPIFLNIFCWFCMLNALFTPFFGPNSVPGRLFHIAIVFFTNFLLLATSFEAVFVFLLCLCLCLWLALEDVLLPVKQSYCKYWDCIISFHKSKVYTIMPNELELPEQRISLADLRRVLVCIILGIYSYFGTGNIASINTFDPATVYCFLTVFSPFIMGALILWKMTIPFIFVGCIFNIIVSLTKRSLKSYILLMILISDIMGLNFFFLVQDSGSWLEIGVSISHYVIMMAMTIGVTLIVAVARSLTGIAVISRKNGDC